MYGIGYSMVIVLDHRSTVTSWTGNLLSYHIRIKSGTTLDLCNAFSNVSESYFKAQGRCVILAQMESTVGNLRTSTFCLSQLGVCPN